MMSLIQTAGHKVVGSSYFHDLQTLICNKQDEIIELKTTTTHCYACLLFHFCWYGSLMPVSFGSPLMQNFILEEVFVKGGFAVYVYIVFVCLVLYLYIFLRFIVCWGFVSHSVPFVYLFIYFLSFTHFCVFWIVVHVICSLTSWNPPHFFYFMFLLCVFGYVCLFVFVLCKNIF